MNIDTSWTHKTLIILTETFRMVINLPKNFLQTQSFFIVWNQNQLIIVFLGTGSEERKLLNFKTSSKTFTQDTKATSNSKYLLNPLWSLSIHPFNTNLLALRGTSELQCICRNQLILHKPYLQCNYVTSLLVFCTG